MSTLSELFFQSAEKFSHNIALSYKKEGVYFPITYKELAKKVMILGGFLQGLGIVKNDKVVILSGNCPEWAISDLAIMAIGAVVVPLHVTFGPEALNRILNHCKAKIIIVSNNDLLNKVLLHSKKLKFVEKIIFLNNLTGIQKDNLGDKVISWQKIFSETNSSSYQKVEQDYDSCASIIYTSGTTGKPKGVVLTHKNFISNIKTLSQLIPVKESDVFLSFLPLSHVLERTAGYYMPLLAGANITYAENVKQLAHNLKEVSPSVIVSVPRIFEKLHEAIWDKVNASSPARKKLFLWALKQKRHTLKYRLADFLVFKKVRKQLGGNLRMAISGGASLNEHISRFFQKIGLLILEGYGLTETSPVISVNLKKQYKFGTVGKVIPGLEVKISAEKEVLVKGPSVFGGYFNEKAQSKLSFDKDGWFCTGDLGFIDHEGFLTIIGRKKEMIVLSNGKKAWPEQIENLLNNDKYISQSMVIGNGQKFISAIIVPDWFELTLFLKNSNLPLQSQEKLIGNPVILSLIQERLDKKINPKLSDVETIKKFILLFQEFSPERGELTPTLKLRRHIIESHYKRQIESLYIE